MPGCGHAPLCRRAVQCGAWMVVALLALWAARPAVGTAPAARQGGGLRIVTDTPRSALWRKVYLRIPGTWKGDREIVVRELTGRDLDKLVDSESGGSPSSRNDDSVVDGYYQNNGGSDEPVVISLRDTLRGEAAQLVFAHEYGHYVWDDLMTTEQHRAYADLWRRQKRARRLVTDYAGEDADEGFAEALSFFVVKPDALRKRDTGSATFLDRLAAREP